MHYYLVTARPVVLLGILTSNIIPPIIYKVCTYDKNRNHVNISIAGNKSPSSFIQDKNSSTF